MIEDRRTEDQLVEQGTRLANDVHSFAKVDLGGAWLFLAFSSVQIATWASKKPALVRWSPFAWCISANRPPEPLIYPPLQPLYTALQPVPASRPYLNLHHQTGCPPLSSLVPRVPHARLVHGGKGYFARHQLEVAKVIARDQVGSVFNDNGVFELE
jgi:hypothetical protein